ncbi:hypothetical protein [Micropruina sp.]|uniref:hypothetical protein n=1 Tax=Micropruina sp. TaxID=2737536 RepID=UPI0039E70F3F
MTERNTPDEDRGDRAERAFRDALQQHADEPDFQPLELPKTVASRSGLPRWLPVAAAVVLVAAVAIPLAISRFSGSSPSSAVPAAAPESTPSDAEPTASALASRPGWRWESYRVLSYQVPDRWGYDFALGTAWCAGRPQRPSEPFVALAPELLPVRAVGCPRNLPAKDLQTFVTVRQVTATDRGWDLPQGWTATTSEEVDGYVVEVVHTDAYATVADQIIASVRPIGAIDPNGCPARSALDPKVVNSSVAGKASVPVTLCQYDLASTPGQLVASKALADNDDDLDYNARQVRAALAKAPKGSGPDDTSCEVVGDTAVLVRLQDGSVPSLGSDVVVRYAGCQGNGIFTATGSHKLTFEACHAVLQRPLIFISGHGRAATLCVPPKEAVDGPTPSRSPTASVPAPTPLPSQSRK